MVSCVYLHAFGGEDVDIKRAGNKLTLTVELTDNPKPSSTGKSLILYTSHGFQWEEDIAINLTVIKRRE